MAGRVCKVYKPLSLIFRVEIEPEGALNNGLRKFHKISIFFNWLFLNKNPHDYGTGFAFTPVGICSYIEGSFLRCCSQKDSGKDMSDVQLI